LLAAAGCAPSALRVAPPDGAASAGAPDGHASFERYAPPSIFAPPGAAPIPDVSAEHAPAWADGPPLPFNSVLVSDFEQPDQAIVVPVGVPPRQGTWFSYSDGNPACNQAPVPGQIYEPATPPLPSPAGGLALHASWVGCKFAGAGARLADDGSGGRLAPYDLSGYTGLTFWALPFGDAHPALRVTLPMTDDARIADGGDCDEGRVGPGKCNDAHGLVVPVPPGIDKWMKILVRFDDPEFAQQGWGAQFPWNPTHVTAIQIESVDPQAGANFWIDDVELTR
jgi:hypothetical protein